MNKKYYEKEFQLQAVKLVIDEKQSLTRVSEDLNINRSTLYRWVKHYNEAQDEAFQNGLQTKEQLEIKKLRKENAILAQERNILKKAVAIFSDTPGKNLRS